MERSSRRSHSSPQPPSLPRMGLLLLLVAIAIVGLPMIAKRFNATSPTMTAQSSSPIKTSQTTEAIQPENNETNQEQSATPKQEPFADDPEFQELLSLIQDRTLEFKPREMAVYWRFLREAQSATYLELESKSQKSALVNDYFQHPEEHRGELSRFEMTIRQVRSFPREENGVATSERIYEIWGSNERAPNWLFVLVTPALPEGMTEASLKGRQTQFAGYFLKLQAYHPAKSKPSDNPMLAPLFVGRASPLPDTSIRARTQSIDTQTVAMLLFSVATVGTIGFWWLRRYQRRQANRETPSEVQPSDLEWIDKL